MPQTAPYYPVCREVAGITWEGCTFYQYLAVPCVIVLSDAGRVAQAHLRAQQFYHDARKVTLTRDLAAQDAMVEFMDGAE